jgi:hypothetical protein
MSVRIMSLVAMAVGAILGVGRSAVAQDPTTADAYGRTDHVFLVGRAHLTVGAALQGRQSSPLHAEVPTVVR